MRKVSYQYERIEIIGKSSASRDLLLFRKTAPQLCGKLPE